MENFTLISCHYKITFKFLIQLNEFLYNNNVRLIYAQFQRELDHTLVYE